MTVVHEGLLDIHVLDHWCGELLWGPSGALFFFKVKTAPIPQLPCCNTSYPLNWMSLTSLRSSYLQLFIFVFIPLLPPCRFIYLFDYLFWYHRFHGYANDLPGYVMEWNQTAE